MSSITTDKSRLVPMKCGCLTYCPNCSEKSSAPKIKSDSENAPPDLICPICLCIATDPPLLECGHIVCRACILKSPLHSTGKCKCGTCGNLSKEEFDRTLEQSGPLVKEQQKRSDEHGHGWMYWKCPHCTKFITDVSIDTVDRILSDKLKNVIVQCS